MPVTIPLLPLSPLPADAAAARPRRKRSATGGPLAGLTLLAVEDSRLAADALRLLCRALGARLRRAATLAEAGRHLSLYRPDAILVDLGLPDGRGEALVAALALSPRRPPAILALSGDPGRGPAALACGADVFLAKPLLTADRLAMAVLQNLPFRATANLPPDPLPAPDPLALADDLTLAAELLADDPDDAVRGYVAAFLGGVARQSGDSVLQSAAEGLAQGADGGLLLRLVEDRLATLPVL